MRMFKEYMVEIRELQMYTVLHMKDIIILSIEIVHFIMVLYFGIIYLYIQDNV